MPVLLADLGPVIDQQDELDEFQIDALLQQATQRLQEKESLALSTTTSKRFIFPKLNTGLTERPSIITRNGVAEVNAEVKANSTDSQGFRRVEDPVTAKALAKENKKATAGSMWYDLPKTNLTPELKRDLQLIKMRGVLDPHRHYRKDNGKMQAPEYSMVGTVMEGATEYFTGRIENKKRKRTIVEEVLAGEQESGRFKKKYGDIQTKKSSGKKAFYKDLKAKRFKGVKKGG